MFIEQGLQDEGNAEQQANRGTFDPAYLNYTMGKLMIKKLREDWTRLARRAHRVEAVSRPVPVLRRPADPDGPQGDDGQGR